MFMKLHADHRLQKALTPRSIAIVGATEDPNKVGGRPLHYLQRFGFTGNIYPVNPKRHIIQGVKAYPSLEALPETPDTVIIAVGQSAVPEVLEECAKRKITTAIVMSSGFGETGVEGIHAQQALVTQARELGIRLIGPNAQGIANFQTGAVMNFSTMFMETPPQDGPVAIISQSGAASVMPYAMLRERGIGVRYLVASGNDAETSVNELALAAVNDPEIRLVLLYIESLTDPEVLIQAAQAAHQRGAAIIVLKSGRSVHGAKAAASHTGAIVNDDIVVDAFLERHGIWRANDVHSLVNAVELYLTMPPRQAERLVVMSHSGAVGVLCADTADAFGLTLAELSTTTTNKLAHIIPSFTSAQNPLDLTASLMTEGGMYSAALNVLSTDNQADMFLIGIPVAGPGYDVVAMAADTARFLASIGKPAVISAPQASVRQIFRQAGVPAFNHETDAIQALHQWSKHGQLIQQASTLHLLEEPTTNSPLLEDGVELFLNEVDSLRFLAEADIPVVPHELCTDLETAIAAWQRFGPEIVLKACSAHIPHKSEHGLVFVGLNTEAQITQAWKQCAERVHAMGIPFEGVIIAKRVKGQREFALGVRQDPIFGTVVMVGDGGKYVEAIRDFIVLLHPFSEAEVIARLQQLRIAPILAGIRGEPPVDLQVLAQAAVQLGQLAASNRQTLASVDINPLIVCQAGAGGWAVDAIVERAPRNDHGK